MELSLNIIEMTSGVEEESLSGWAILMVKNQEGR